MEPLDILKKVSPGMLGNWDYEYIKALAKDEGISYKDYIVLAPQNDPFYSGTSGDIEKAEWFADLWNKWGSRHLRALHYKVQAPGNIKKPDGTIYKNNKLDWKYLLVASKQARYLGYLEPEQFVDRRNEAPNLLAVYEHTEINPSYTIPDPDFKLPEIRELGNYMMIDLPEIEGYEYRQDDQKYHIEIWIEKSTMNDELIPICKDYNINLLVGSGFTSITRCNEFLARVQGIGKPARVFYISDHDHEGQSMPVAVSRQLEFWSRKKYPDLDIKLNPLMLTQDQIDEYDLPHAPDSDEVELDALKALHPGEFEKIVRMAVSEYVDTSLSDEFETTEDEAQDQINEEWEDAIESQTAEFEEINSEVDEIIIDYNERIKPLKDELDTKLKPYKERLESLRHGIAIEKEKFKIDLPERPVADIQIWDEEDWLFSSDRDYEDQLEKY